MEPLSGAEKRRLRGAAHSLKPVVHLGRDGADQGVLDEIDRALEHHQLIKVRFVAGQDERRATAREIEQALSCGVVGMVGHVLILYRPAEDD